MGRQKQLMDAMTMNCEHVADRIVEFLRHKAAENCKEGICLGISGGVDSAVMATLAVKATNDPSKVHGLYLPDRDSDEKYRNHAFKLTDGLKIKLQTVDFSNRAKAEGIYDSLFVRFLRISPRLNRWGLWLYKRTLHRRWNANKHERDAGSCKKKSQVFSTTIFHIFKKNLSTSAITSGFISRHILRRQILEKYAEDNNLLLVGAANKSELFAGWFVKNGVDDLPVAPISGLYKNQVIQMAKYLNIPQEIIAAKPSPDMLKGVHDEDLIGYPYDKIDKVAYVVEHGLPKQRAYQEGVSPQEFENILSLHHCTAPKRTNKHESPAFE